MTKASKKNTTKSRIPKFWVGIGASAGGLEALRGFFRNLQTDLDATYIIAQHMSPHHKSMLTEIIGRETSMPALEITDNLKPLPNTVYITPPNSNVVVKGRKLRLIDPSKAVGAPKPSVNVFLTSLAETLGENAVGVIMSGTGSDGAEGITAVHERGGVTVAQDEMTAKYSSMPSAAIETGDVDLIMSPEELGAQLSQVITVPRNLDILKASPINLDGVSELLSLLHSKTKVNFKYYKTPTFQRRVARRMAALDIEKLPEYVKIAREKPEEVEELYKDLLISVTAFFRDANEFEALKYHLRNIVQKIGDEYIRVWIPGVATGQEAYTIAILFHEICREFDPPKQCKLQIFGTDLDKNAIEIARRGFYPQTEFTEMDPDIFKRYFDSAPKGYQVKKMIREKVVFSIHNVAQDPPFLNLDLVSCRNLLIYFQAQLQAEVFARFHYSLKPNGLLFLGKSEAVAASEDLFRLSDRDKHIFFQRPNVVRKIPNDVLHGTPPRLGIHPNNTYSMPKPNIKKQSLEKRFDQLVAAIGPDAIITNSDFLLIKSFGQMSKYIGLDAGMVSTKATSLLIEPYRQDVRFSVPVAIRKKTKVVGNVRQNLNNKSLKNRIVVYPLDGDENEEDLALVVFEEWEEQVTDASDDGLIPPDAVQQFEQLSNELAITRTNLQQTTEELETSNEELQAVNEELQSSNEELQSTNEELETSNEELQSTNEELSTVNEELQVNAQQLGTLNQDLKAVLHNISVPMFVVDRSLNITYISLATENIFKIEADLALLNLNQVQIPDGFPNLIQGINTVFFEDKTLEFEVASDAVNATVKISPYYSESGEIIGAIIVLNDNTKDLVAARNELQLIFDNVPEAIKVRDADGHIIRANLATDKLLGLENGESRGTNIYDYYHASIRDKIKASDKQILESGIPSIDEDRKIIYKDGRELWVKWSRIPVQHDADEKPLLYVVKQDITQEYLDRKNLQISERRLNTAIEATSIGLWERDFVTGEVYWSNEAREIAGIPLDAKITFESFTSHIHPDDLEQIHKTRTEHISGHKPYYLQYRYLKNDGSYIWVESYAQAERDSQGNVIKFTGTFSDISKQKSDLIEMATINSQLNLASQLSGVGYWVIGISDSALLWSAQVFIIHGLTPEEYTPELESAINFYHPDDLESVTHHVNKAIQGGERFEFQARLRHKDGSYRKVNAVGQPYKDDGGKVVNVFGVFQDITEAEKHADQLKSTLNELSRSNEELNRFSYVCSHDMKEPVRMIEMMSSLLLDPNFEVTDEKRGEIFERIENNTKRLRNIIDNLLAFSRIDAKVEMSKVDLSAVLKEIKTTSQPAFDEKNATLKVLKLPSVWGARIHFLQLFQNLIGNALKFNNQEKPLVKVSAKKLKNVVIISVEDNGPGIDEKSREKVFEVFSRLQRRDEIEGSGLGLSIVQKIVSQYKGTIKCNESSLGGAKFEITLPNRDISDA